MRFRRRRFGGLRRTREPLIWQRQQFSLNSGTGGSIVAQELVDPDFLMSATALTTDQRWTLRRLIMNLNWVVTSGFTTATNPLMVFAGIVNIDDTATVRSPRLANADDTRADWMWLGCGALEPPVGIANFGSVGSRVDPANSNMIHIDVRTARKESSAMSPAFAFEVIDVTTGSQQAAGVVQLRYQVSALWSRTRR